MMQGQSTGASWSYPRGLFDAYGVELEYMIVDAETLDVAPLADRLFAAASGGPASDVAPSPGGKVSWSNELVLHVAEFKTDAPEASLDDLLPHFEHEIARANRHLAAFGARLLPTGMHPWMDPGREAAIWPHEYTAVYNTYDRIFGCKSHGYANLQSTHLNLPFANDAEFGRLHLAIRAILPLLPALAASSPFAEGRASTLLDHRLEVYRTNSARVPHMAGQVIPEPIADRASYERDILGRLYADLAPLDPEGHLRYEFANARGAIARFDRGAIEIRILDIQECPAQDLAILAFVTALVRAGCEERFATQSAQRALSTDALQAIFLDVIRDGEHAVIEDRAFLQALGHKPGRTTARALLERLLGDLLPNHPLWTGRLERLLVHGSLASRLRRAVRGLPTRETLHAVYAELAAGLATGQPFRMG